MSIRRKLLNDLNKQKEKTSKALDFAQILDDDDDDFFEDDIDIKDTVDFSHYTEEEFAKLDDFYAMANMSHQTYEKFKEIKKRYRQQQKIQKALEKEKADNQIRQITADDLQELVYTIPFIPSRFGSGKTANKTILQAIKMAKVDETLPRLSIKTQNDYIQTLSSIFMWAKKKKFIDENPFDEVEMPAQDIRDKQGDKYLSFSITQLQAIFNTPVYRGCMNNKLGRMTPGKKIYRDAYFWVPLISLYSGARLNEICQLSLDDVRIKEGINIIHISNVEGKNCFNSRIH